MKNVIVAMLFALMLVGCTKSNDTDKAVSESAQVSEDGDEINIESNSDQMEGNVDAELEEDGLVQGDEEQVNEGGGIVEENDSCICTKDYRPVCGANGVTYPNACQAGCESVTEFTEGSCE